MADAKPSCCPKCGAAATFVSCPACGSVFWKDLAGWTAGLSVAVAVCLLVVAYAASVWLKVGAGAAMLGCVGGLMWVRVSLLRAARLRSPQALPGEAATPLHVQLWTAAAAILLGGSITAGLALYAAADTRPEPQVVHKPPAESPAAKPNPLPVAVTFRPSPDGAGQAVYLSGEPGGEPLLVEITTSPPATDPRLPVVPVVSKSRLGGWVGVAAQLREQQQADEREREQKRLYSATVQVRPGVEAPVAWRAGDSFRLPAGQAVTLRCPGYDPLTTSVSVPLKNHRPAPAVSPVFRPPGEYRPPSPLKPVRPAPVDPEQQKRAREAVARQLTTSFRESLVGKGKVLVITNAGPAAVPPLQVRVLRLSRIVRGTNEVVAEYTLAKGLSAGQKAEVGWVELDKELQSGDWAELLLGGDVIKSARVE